MGGVSNIVKTRVEQLRPLGYAQDTTISAASALPSIPAGARMAKIQVLTQSARYRDDGTDPTAAIGMLIAAGETIEYWGDLSAFKVIETTTTAELNVSYYG